uniref:Putative ovule protein n=1 Tax=Solanum chacoense TaxID=4108 RepID=A0A0V0HF31_SOLCH
MVIKLRNNVLKESTIRDNYINVICRIKPLFNGINASFLEEEASAIHYPCASFFLFCFHRFQYLC